MSERKKTNLIKLAVVLGILIIVGLLFLFGVFDNSSTHYRVINQADDAVYQIGITCYNPVVTPGGSYEFGASIQGKRMNYQGLREAFAYGEKIDLNPQYRNGTAFGDALTVDCRIQNNEVSDPAVIPKVTENQVTVPYAKGKRPVLILTGNKEDGYELTYTGKSVNWLIG